MWLVGLLDSTAHLLVTLWLKLLVLRLPKLTERIYPVGSIQVFLPLLSESRVTEILTTIVYYRPYFKNCLDDGKDILLFLWQGKVSTISGLGNQGLKLLYLKFPETIWRLATGSRRRIYGINYNW
ncbi:hypothetical protein IQ264_10595 [Phormidium sp. LEGE 05292]|uniref:hypothetical protein n=1 Tax=[Phormidium] sp. LEGE 05292 TaxID=767427 RepID=UPI00187F9DAA|nr:hypothetical protein [Phormidium sp. LEGE 05292]MBE9225873.1 hypothetical protein [Phormidium sp. LEGE 05292]